MKTINLFLALILFSGVAYGQPLELSEEEVPSVWAKLEVQKNHVYKLRSLIITAFQDDFGFDCKTVLDRTQLNVVGCFKTISEGYEAAFIRHDLTVSDVETDDLTVIVTGTNTVNRPFGKFKELDENTLNLYKVFLQNLIGEYERSVQEDVTNG